MRDCILLVCWQKTKKMNATSNLRGCFAFESNQTHKKQSLIDERLHFVCLLAKNKK